MVLSKDKNHQGLFCEHPFIHKQLNLGSQLLAKKALETYSTKQDQRYSVRKVPQKSSEQLIT